MKKYMIVGLLLLQGALVQASEVEFYKAIQPSLQSAKLVLYNSRISVELDPILNELVREGQRSLWENEIISRRAILKTINDIKNAVEAYKSKQYSNSWLSWFVSTPKIVKDTVQPALDKVNNAIAALNGNELSSLAITGIVVGSVAGAVAATGSAYAAYEWNENRKKRIKDAAADNKPDFVDGQDDDEMQEARRSLAAADKGRARSHAPGSLAVYGSTQLSGQDDTNEDKTPLARANKFLNQARLDWQKYLKRQIDQARQHKSALHDGFVESATLADSSHDYLQAMTQLVDLLRVNPNLSLKDVYEFGRLSEANQMAVDKVFNY